MRPVPKILLDITKSVSSSGVQFLVTLVTTPLMTRLYTPAAYATFGVLYSTATLVVGIGMLSLTNAYPIEKEAAKRSDLLRVMALQLCGITLFAMLIAAVMDVTESFTSDRLVLLLLPVLVLTYGLRQILVSIATAHANFSSIALGQLIEPGCSRGGSIALGAAFGSHPAFILFSVAVGHVATAFTIVKMATKASLREWRWLFRPGVHPIAVMKRYHDFVLFYTASQQAQPLVLLGLQMVLVALFSKDVAGQYILAVSILTLPISLIAMTASSVTYRHMIDIEHTAPERLTRHLLRAMLLYLLAGILILSPVMLFGEWIFRIAFSKVWVEAGHVASILSFGYMGMFTLMGVQSIFRVTRRIHTQFIIEAGTGLLALIIAAACFKTLGFMPAMACLSGLWLVRSLIMLYACAAVAHSHQHRLRQAHG